MRVTIYLLTGMILQVCESQAFSSSSAALTPAMLLLVASAALSAYTFYLIGTLVENGKPRSNQCVVDGRFTYIWLFYIVNVSVHIPWSYPGAYENNLFPLRRLKIKPLSLRRVCWGRLVD